MLQMREVTKLGTYKTIMLVVSTHLRLHGIQAVIIYVLKLILGLFLGHSQILSSSHEEFAVR